MASEELTTDACGETPPPGPDEECQATFGVSLAEFENDTLRRVLDRLAAL